jgi:hypothetical protein
MNAARPATISPSQPPATARIWRIQVSVFSLVRRASACAAAFRLFFPETREMLLTDYVARERPVRDAEIASAVQRSAVGQQCHFVTGIHECATERCDRSGVALRAVSQRNELHEGSCFANSRAKPSRQLG